jgi:serine protease Do
MKRLLILAVVVGGGALLITGNRWAGAPASQPLIVGTEPLANPTTFGDVARRVLPAVVSIETRRRVQKKSGSADGGEADDGTQFGSGWLTAPVGTVVTNYHVVEGAELVEVRLADGRRLLSRDIRTDPKSDLAVVRVSAKGELPALEFGDSNTMDIGDRVLAVGAPFGLAGSVTHGIISGKGRSLNLNLYENLLQTDAAINPGNSGGPLVNLEGKVIGITEAIKTKSGGFEGVGLAIPSETAHSVVAALLKDGAVHRSYLGAQTTDLDDPDIIERLGLSARSAVVVSRIFPDTPAARAGLQEGDVIVTVNGRPIKEVRELQSTMAELPAGKAAEMKIVRDGAGETLKVSVEEQPKDYTGGRAPVPQPPRDFPPSLRLNETGFSVCDLSPELAGKMSFRPGLTGALVTSVKRDGTAADWGLGSGTAITKVDRHSVRSAAQCKERIAAGNLEDGVLLQIYTVQGGAGYMLLRTAK